MPENTSKTRGKFRNVFVTPLSMRVNVADGSNLPDFSCEKIMDLTLTHACPKRDMTLSQRARRFKLLLSPTFRLISFDLN